MQNLYKLRDDFWGSVPTAHNRREKIRAILQKASAEYSLVLKTDKSIVNRQCIPLTFRVGNKVVCEKSFVAALGMNDKKGNKSKNWCDEVSMHLGKFTL